MRARLRAAWFCCAVWAGVAALDAAIQHDLYTIVTGGIACVFSAVLAVTG